MPPPTPAKDEWVAWTPALPGVTQGAAVLSEHAATWIVDVLGTIEKLRGVRAAEHKCLDNLEKKGLITQ